jgi:predicted CXXCH cytochrome family protein
VVGHVEQLHLSRCYQRSATLTCVTCHDPHGEPKPEQRVDYYRDACLVCHKAPQRECRVSEERRAKESPANDCVHCHMPRSPTEIPHLAFTHHRIAIHDRPAIPGAARSPDLAAFADLSRFPDIDRRRSLGLGYLEAANRERDPQLAQVKRMRALDLLNEARGTGLRDPLLDTALARVRFDMGLGDVLSLADSALAHPGFAGRERCNALYLRADALARESRFAEAVEALRQLVALRRHSADWLLLAECERSLGHTTAWADALATAARINPRLPRAHQTLADHFSQKGDVERAAWHRRRAVP